MTKNNLDPEQQQQLYNIQRQAFSDALREHRRKKAIAEGGGKLIKILALPICILLIGAYLENCVINSPPNFVVTEKEIIAKCKEAIQRSENLRNQPEEQMLQQCRENYRKIRNQNR